MAKGHYLKKPRRVAHPPLWIFEALHVWLQQLSIHAVAAELTGDDPHAAILENQRLGRSNPGLTLTAEPGLGQPRAGLKQYRVNSLRLVPLRGDFAQRSKGKSCRVGQGLGQLGSFFLCFLIIFLGTISLGDRRGSDHQSCLA